MFFYVVCNISYYIYVTLVCCVRGAYSHEDKCQYLALAGYLSAKIIKKHKFVLLIYVYLLLFILKIAIFVMSN